MRQILVIHGGNFHDSHKEFVESLKKERVTKEDLVKTFDKRWKDNLAADLGGEFEVFTPEMPNSQDAKYDEWKIWFEKFFPFLTDGVVLIGHSLGGVFLARYLSENKFPKKIAALFLVAAPFFKPSKKLGVKANAGFTVKDDLKKIESQAGEIFIFHSSDDSVVAISHAKVYKKYLPKAKFVQLHGLGHFRMDHFPELVNEIQSLAD